MRELIIVRGGGDIATGCVQKLHRAGFGVIVLETARPTAIRRGAALCEAVHRGRATVEDMTAMRAEKQDAAGMAADRRLPIPVVVDPDAELAYALKPFALVDALLAKQNRGTRKNMARFVIALGPGFSAPEDADAVIETMRGHNLGRVITCGRALANTGVPGSIGGFTRERVLYAPTDGRLHTLCAIGDTVVSGQLLAQIGDTDVTAPIGGVLRGVLPDGFDVWKGLKLADIDPRVQERENCFTISDKARCIGGAVLEAILTFHTKAGVMNETK